MVAESIFVKNVALQYGGFSPYVAVFGQFPKGLFSIESHSIDSLEDGGKRPEPDEPETGNLANTIRL